MSSRHDTVSPWAGRDVPALVSVEQIAHDLFIGRLNQVNFYGSLFGGQVLGQSIAAACATVDGRPMHSMHGYFLRPGAGDRPVEYRVERTRDGRSFSTRRVTGSQAAEPIFQMECSFHADEPGWDHQSSRPDVPPPDALEELASIALRADPAVQEILARRFGPSHPLSIRPVQGAGVLDRQSDNRRQIWFRVPSASGHDDPALHLQILAWMADAWISGAALVLHAPPLPGPNLFLASIDHAMWFHRPVRTDDWLLFDTDSPSAAGATGLSRGLIHDRAGRLVATVVQESLQRRVG